MLTNLKEDAASKDIIGIGKILQTVKSIHMISSVALITCTDYSIFDMVNLVMIL